MSGESKGAEWLRSTAEGVSREGDFQFTVRVEATPGTPFTLDVVSGFHTPLLPRDWPPQAHPVNPMTLMKSRQPGAQATAQAVREVLREGAAACAPIVGILDFSLTEQSFSVARKLAKKFDGRELNSVSGRIFRPAIRNHLMGHDWLLSDWAVAWMSLAWHRGVKGAFSDPALFSEWTPWELCCPQARP